MLSVETSAAVERVVGCAVDTASAAVVAVDTAIAADVVVDDGQRDEVIENRRERRWEEQRVATIEGEALEVGVEEGHTRRNVGTTVVVLAVVSLVAAEEVAAVVDCEWVVRKKQKQKKKGEETWIRLAGEVRGAVVAGAVVADAVAAASGTVVVGLHTAGTFHGMETAAVEVMEAVADGAAAVVEAEQTRVEVVEPSVVAVAGR